jgi:hypothetical protein
MVALDEGKGVCTYARATGMHRAAMSRYLHEIGDKTRYGAPGLGLVAVGPHPVYPRRRQVLLTEKGRLIAREMFQNIRRAYNGGPESLESLIPLKSRLWLREENVASVRSWPANRCDKPRYAKAAER